MTPVFVHVAKTAGGSIRVALSLPPLEGGHHISVRDKAIAEELKAPDPYLFASVRHPLDRAVSAFHWMAAEKERDPGRAALSAVLRSLEDANELFERVELAELHKNLDVFKRQVWYLRDAPAGMKLIRFENLQADFAEVAAALGRPDETLPHIHRSARRLPWHEELSQRSVDRLVEFYRPDFDYLGYPLP